MQPLELPKGKAVRVHWQDSAMLGGWSYGDKEFRPEQIVSLAYVVETNQDCLTLTTTISNSDGIVAALMIPWGAIDTLEELPPEWNRRHLDLGTKI